MHPFRQTALAAKDTKIGLCQKYTDPFILKISATREGTSIAPPQSLQTDARQYVSFALIANQAFDIFLIFIALKFNVLYRNQEFSVRKYKIDICENCDIMDILGISRGMSLFAYV